mmetsp:Transcript_76694/g.112333  ORF Transcript_76694/g.112333 Transcript_76694/m.112333 type:complete len:291 (+) Transcript_76694:85-957(+)|eukprot:CAMPEP_0179432672 /NCGR_PEP_ID=MMETSP0799-20121207/17234_1 /TAXON_ID=46947 /ORGANISM="Geminigera cryophila, Strain CCMP2564" /LENGTH=290 /DNA_ID=CAMNT_0021210181 /DNA_START=48 /DNA_END=920 /DNA_ORIENTATION=+
MPKRKDEGDAAAPHKRGKKEAKVEGSRTSVRERNAPASYNEEKLESVVHEREEKKTLSTGGGAGNVMKYVAPCDPPGMKSSAYLCKYPAVKGPTAQVIKDTEPLPTRNANGELCFADHPQFRPNLTPAQVLEQGAFGGTYYRKIKSVVTGLSYEDVHKEFPDEWFKGLSPKQYKNGTYRGDVNKWGVECGGALDMWESSGWISNLDPYGWFQWYCRFYQGRRTSDDIRQISRINGVAGPKGRFRNQLINKVLAAGVRHNDAGISPVIRQTLHHWAYELTEKDLESARKKK